MYVSFGSSPSTLLLTLFCVIHSLSVRSPVTCPTGCKCSDVNGAAVCCLPPTNGKNRYVDKTGTNVPMSQLCLTNTSTAEPRWPLSSSCLSTWRQLQVRLSEHSWPSDRPHFSHVHSSCTENLEQLILSGTPSIDDGLLELDPFVLRNLFFQASGILRLRHLVVQQTNLRTIKPGFIDQLSAIRLVDLEIHRNPHLTCDGLGVGWLAGASHLRLLNLSRNRLVTINLAKWGFALANPSALITLDLSGNQIAHLKAKTFSRVPNLLKLDLSENMLTVLPLNVFTGLDSLKILNLQGNQLTVVGLKVVPLSFASVMPNLRHLQLSGNPLLIINETSPHWWLSDICPKHLTQLNLERLTSQLIAPLGTHMMLPPVAWDKCPALNQLVLTGTDAVPCLSQQWFGLPPHAIHVPDGIRVMPQSFRLCPPSAMIPTTGETVGFKSGMEPALSPSISFTPTSPNGANKLVFVDPNVLSVSNDQRYSEPMIHPGTDSSESSPHQVFRILRLHSVGLDPWLLLSLLLLLFVLVICVSVWVTVYWVRPYCTRHKHITNHLTSTEHPIAGSVTKFTSLTTYPDSEYHHAASLLSSRAAYSPLNLSLNGDGSDYVYSPYKSTHAAVRLLSPVDSGMGDVTPVTIQNAFPFGLSPSSSHASVRLSRTDPRTRHALSCEGMRFHVPSFVPVRPTRLQSTKSDYASLPPHFLNPHKCNHNNDPSIEDVSTHVESITDDNDGAMSSARASLIQTNCLYSVPFLSTTDRTLD